MGGLSDRVHRPRDDQLDPELTEFDAGAARIASGAVAGLQAVGAHEARVNGERQRGVRKPGMDADFFFGVALTV